ncbi:MAG TPA: PHP domain-containing protein [Phycisphaerales bacterium]|nr:PHP domain-containing protein [Phycisphaerales bacterium]
MQTTTSAVPDPSAPLEGYCDLHAHSTASDGTDTPTQLAHEANRVGLRTLALTDHDTTAGLAECAAACAALGIEFVPGTELSCDIDAILDSPPGESDGVLHILGLFIRHNDPGLLTLCQQQRDRRNEHVPRMLAALAALGMPVTMEEVAALSGGQVIGRMHVAAALLAHSYVASIAEAFQKYIGTHGPANPPREFVHPREAITTIHAAGGVAVLAHPVQLKCGTDAELRTAVTRLRDMGLDSLEVLHSDHTPELTAKYTVLARERNVLTSGGSDYHGSNKPKVRLGSQQVPATWASALDALRSATTSSES